MQPLPPPTRPHTLTPTDPLSLSLSLSLCVSLCLRLSSMLQSRPSCQSVTIGFSSTSLAGSQSLSLSFSLSLSPSFSLSLDFTLSFPLSLTLFGYGRPLHHTTSPHSDGFQQWLLIELKEWVLRNNCCIKI